MDLYKIEAADILRRFIKQVIPERNGIDIHSCNPNDLAGIQEHAIKTYEAVRTERARGALQDKRKPR